MGVVEAVERDLERLGGDLAESALAATARVLASKMDDPRNSATSISMVSKSLTDVMRELHALAPPKEVRDDVTDLTAERERRRAAARSAAAPDLSRS